jgi:NADH:ubiquinone reductase (H+-translocating)
MTIFFYFYNNNRLSMAKLHKIVIIGGGAGGLELATQLGDSLGRSQKAEIVLIDQKLTHVWKPLLHEIAAGILNPHEEEINYFTHALKHHYQFILGQFIELDRVAKQIKIISTHPSKTGQQQSSYVDYDTLVLAIGSTSNDFNTEGVKAHCHFIDNLQQADLFHQDLLNLYLDAQHAAHDRDLNIAIIGAGATGVELAAELIEAKESFAQYGLNKVDKEKVSIRLIEASPRILPALSETIASQTLQQLEQMGVQVLTNHRVAKVSESSVYFADASVLPAEIKVWAAGIKAPEVLAHLKGFEKDNINRLKVYATLQTKTDPNIFAFGDCAHCQPTADGPVLGPRAQVASQQASFLVGALKAHVKGQSLPMFKFSEKGSLVSLSQYKAVGNVMDLVNVQGIVAKAMYVSLYRIHQINIHGYTHAGVLTAKALVARKFGPKIKLH